MTEFASWAPNPHALIVHLPVGLLVTAVATDLIAMLRRDPSTVVSVSTGLYLAGTVALVVAYVTGRDAAPVVYTPGMAQAIVSQHWDRAYWCVWYFGLVTTGRLALRFRPGRVGRLIAQGLGVAGLAGLLLLATTAELGGRLVYQHGVGVAAPVARKPRIVFNRRLLSCAALTPQGVNPRSRWGPTTPAEYGVLRRYDSEPVTPLWSRVAGRLPTTPARARECAPRVVVKLGTEY